MLLRTFGFIVVALFILDFCNPVRAGIAVEGADPNRKHNGHCYATEGNLGEMAKGETKTVPGTCIEATCLDDKSVKYYYCPPIAAEYPCYVLPPDPPLPGCCDRVVCNKPREPVMKVIQNAGQSLDNQNVEAD